MVFDNLKNGSNYAHDTYKSMASIFIMTITEVAILVVNKDRYSQTMHVVFTHSSANYSSKVTEIYHV